MRVALVARSARSGGGVTHASNLFQRLRPLLEDRGHEIVEVVFPQVDHKSLSKVASSDAVLCLGNRTVGFRASTRTVLCVENRLLLPQLPVSHRLSFRRRIRQLLLMKGLLTCSSVVVPSESMVRPLRALLARLPGKRNLRVSVIFQGRPDWDPPDARPFPKPLRLLYTSFFGSHKNVGLLGAVLDRLANLGISAELTLTAMPSDSVGGTGLGELFAGRPVRFIGKVGPSEMRDVYAEHDIFVFPSLAESFGHPLVEAMVSNMPVVASDLDFAREVCGNGATFCHPSRPDEWAGAIMRIAQSAERSNPAGVAQSRRFSWDEAAERYLYEIEQTARH